MSNPTAKEIAAVKQWNDDFTAKNTTSIRGAFKVRSVYNRVEAAEKAARGEESPKKDNAVFHAQFNAALMSGDVSGIDPNSRIIVKVGNNLLTYQTVTFAKNLIAAGITPDRFIHSIMVAEVCTYPEGTQYHDETKNEIAARKSDATMPVGAFEFGASLESMTRKEIVQSLTPEQKMELLRG